MFKSFFTEKRKAENFYKVHSLRKYVEFSTNSFNALNLSRIEVAILKIKKKTGT